MKITFKNVGQGDSIVIEWEGNDSKVKYGFVDCNLYFKTNPLLDHIKTNDVKVIEFLILSHPHYDHYSGFKELIEYCVNQGIIIKYFLHTCSQVPDYLITAVKSLEAEKSLQDLFLYLRALRDQGVIRVGEIMAGSISSTVSLTQKIKLNILAPSSKEKDNYIKGANLHNPEEGLNNNANANLLSTILQISDNEEYILLTSDAEKSSLIRIDKEEKVLLEKKLAICQSPHHGAFRNHNNSFWRKRNKQENPIVAFSVGDNHYGHPNAKVVDFFRKNEFTIFSTNYIGGLSPDQSNVKAKEVSSTLDLISRKKNVNNTSSGAGDITLNIF